MSEPEKIQSLIQTEIILNEVYKNALSEELQKTSVDQLLLI